MAQLAVREGNVGIGELSEAERGELARWRDEELSEKVFPESDEEMDVFRQMMNTDWGSG